MLVSLPKLHVGVSTPNMNVQMLVNAMHNLSELLLFHCSNDASALNEQNHEALGHTINNLDACKSKKIACMTPTRESMFSQQGISHKLGELPDLHEGASAGRPKVTREAAANSHGQLDCQCMHEEKRNYYKHCKKADKFSDLVSLRDDADSEIDDDMVQAIKKVLNENFHGEEEKQSQTLLYKNLWLEAEAALCSISYRARFNRLKNEMEKCKSYKAKDVSEDTRAVEKLPSSDVSPNPNITHRLTPEAKDSPIPDTSPLDSPISSTTSRNDVEASVMARYQVLKFRGDSSNSANTEGQLPEVVDAAFEGKRNCWPFVGDQSEGGILYVELEPHLEHHTGRTRFDRLRVQMNQMDKCKSHNAKDVLEDTRAVEKLPSSIVLPDSYIAHRLTPEAKDRPIPDTSTLDSPISSTTGYVNDVEASVMVRETAGHLLETNRRVGFWMLNLEPHFEYHTCNRSEDKFGSYVDGSDYETVKELRECVTDGPVIQSCRNTRMGNQLLSGWYDNSSSDWEHVMKDEFLPQN
ncbi:hypothetical protein F0562_026796 [Nyssa sinensis]|uniref:Uncharacterized protein n=1 Tax=Nyssa sinensis TaxID=561372 RepID=A0A5J5BBS4_9ASTE|nr:hypothetical protein F0562_026796 [Nyssa sinensis]